MPYAGIFVLLFAIIAIHEAQSQCNGAMCETICNELDSGTGICVGNECDCSSGKKCSEMIDVACDAICDKIKLQGKCDDNGICTCTAKLVPCFPWECQTQCLDDPRAAECEALGGFVTAVGCLKYGWIRTCGCLCTLFGTNTSFYEAKYNNYFLPVKANKSHNYQIISKNL